MKERTPAPKQSTAERIEAGQNFLEKILSLDLIEPPETWQYLVVCCSQIGCLCFSSLYYYVKTM